MNLENSAINEDKLLFTETGDEGYSPKVFVTKNECIGMNVGGEVFVMPIRAWHKMAKQNHELKDLG